MMISKLIISMNYLTFMAVIKQKSLKKVIQKGMDFQISMKNILKFKANNLNILEIGSYAGASAAAFSKFLPNSKIFCFDVNISNFKYSAKNIFVFGLDVEMKKCRKKFKKFYLIINLIISIL